MSCCCSNTDQEKETLETDLKETKNDLVTLAPGRVFLPSQGPFTASPIEYLDQVRIKDSTISGSPNGSQSAGQSYRYESMTGSGVREDSNSNYSRNYSGLSRQPSFPRGARQGRVRDTSYDSSVPSPGGYNGTNLKIGMERNESYTESSRDRVGESFSGNSIVKVVQNGLLESEGKLSVGIDFGTTFSGLAYGSTRLFSGQIKQILSWPGSYETYRKVPSCILYAQNSPDEEARVIAWGLEAKNAAPGPGIVKCEWFKLFLSPEALRDRTRDPRLPGLPIGKEPIDVIVDFLRCLWTYAKSKITEEIGSVVDLDAADVLLTVPAAWDAAGCAIMREAAIQAGLVKSSRGGDTKWRDRLRIITEPEAAAIHASTLSTLHNLKPTESFIICDAGGGTVDTAVYRLIGQLSELEIAERCVRSGSNCGSLFVDLRFEELLRQLLIDHPNHLDPPSLAAFMHSFSETEKVAYHGTAEDDQDSYDPAVGLERGELAIPGHILRREVFDPVIDQVLALLELQMSKIPDIVVDALIMVGGFASSEYLFARVQETFGSRIRVIARPNDCDVATLQGAARYGLGLSQGKATVSNVISPRAYIMKVKLPAEMIDQYQRPNFIVENDAGIQVCENRLSYLVAKGAVLRKGQRLRSRFCKYTKGPHDSIFTAVLHVSDSDKIFRYTDEGETHELCRWTVDLSALPSYHQIAQTGGGYVEFDLGLELDSAEVRGVLMTDDGVECGRATFEFLGT